jgi:hypothetical protein
MEVKNRIMKEEKYDLEERLIAFAVRVIRMAESLPNACGAAHSLSGYSQRNISRT